MRREFFATGVSVAVLITTSAARADQTLLSIGDSLGFGEQLFTGPSNGDRGFIGDYANYLATQNGGTRPNVLNLDIDGETTSSFTSGTNRVAPFGGTTDAYLQSLNVNYTSPTQTQAQLLASSLTSQAAGGHMISTVSVSLGFNDADALAGSAFYKNATPAQQATMLASFAQTFQSNEDAILSNLRMQLPNARLVLVGIYNPFPGDPNNPPPGFGTVAMTVNQVIAAEAAKYNGVYVDTYNAFVGHEVAYTHIADAHPITDNVHPNDVGYAVIAGLIESSIQAQAVPEPATLTLLGIGLVGALAVRRRRR